MARSDREGEELLVLVLPVIVELPGPARLVSQEGGSGGVGGRRVLLPGEGLQPGQGAERAQGQVTGVARPGGGLDVPAGRAT